MSNTKLPALPGAVQNVLLGDDWQDVYTADQMHTYALQALADRERQAGEAVTVESIRAAGGIVHGDGNIFFTNIAQLRASLPAPQGAQAIKTPEAFQALANALVADPGYAWSWHCAVWASAHDEGMETGAANRAAARFMHMAFGIDTSKNENFSTEWRAAAPSPDGKAEQAEAPSEVLEALNYVDDFIARCNGDDRGSCESVNILRRALATQPTACNAGEWETQRAAFEREYEAYCQPAEADWFRREDDDPDEYYHVATKEAWWGWCTALASKPPAGEQKTVEFAIDGYKGEDRIRWYISELNRVRFLNQWLADAYCNRLRDLYKDEYRAKGYSEKDATFFVNNKLSDVWRERRNDFAKWWDEGRKRPDDLLFEVEHDALSQRLIAALPTETTQPEQVVQDKEDAENYRWLRDKSQDDVDWAPTPSYASGHGIKVVWQGAAIHSHPTIFLHGENLDDAIRAARTRGNGVEPS